MGTRRMCEGRAPTIALRSAPEIPSRPSAKGLEGFQKTILNVINASAFERTVSPQGVSTLSRDHPSNASPVKGTPKASTPTQRHKKKKRLEFRPVQTVTSAVLIGCLSSSKLELFNLSSGRLRKLNRSKSQKPK